MKKLLSFFALISLLIACSKTRDTENPVIFNYTVTNVNQSGYIPDTISIDEDSKAIYLLFPGSFSSSAFPLKITATFSLSPGAKSEPASGSVITFNSAGDLSHYQVTASDGTVVTYKVLIRDNQIPDSGFEDWYTTEGMNGKPFQEPGLAEDNTSWATANMGTSTFGLNCTTPVTDGTNKMVRIITGETSLVPVTTGTIYNGIFDVEGAISHPTDPKQATNFGIPFSLRPSSFSFRYSYIPGNIYVQAKLKNADNIFGGFTITPVEGSDMFTAYAVLERRTADGVTEIARAEMVSGDIQNEMKEVTLPFTYTSSAKPTHIYLVFSSSKDGDLWRGAVGSTLTLDDVKLNYNSLK